MTSSTNLKSRRRAKRFRYSLRTLALLIAVVAAILSFWVRGAVQQDAAVNAFLRHRAIVTYDFGASQGTLKTPRAGHRHWSHHEKTPPGPDWVWKYANPNLFYPVIDVHFFSDRNQPIPTSDLIPHLALFRALEGLDLSYTTISTRDLVKLRALPRLRALYLGRTELCDSDVAVVAELLSLEHLDLSNTRITDQGVKHLRKLASLNILSLSGAQVTDKGLAYLEELQDLQVLWLHRCPVTQQAIEQLSKKLPECTIFWTNAEGEAMCFGPPRRRPWQRSTK